MKVFTLLLYYFSLSCHTMRWQRSLLRRTFRSTTAEVQRCEMCTGAKSNEPPVVLCMHLHYSADPLDKIARWNEMLPALPRSLTSLSRCEIGVSRASSTPACDCNRIGLRGKQLPAGYPQVTRKPETRVSYPSPEHNTPPVKLRLKSKMVDSVHAARARKWRYLYSPAALVKL